MEAQAAFVGPATVVVLHTETDERSYGAVVHADVALDLQLASGRLQVAGFGGVELEDLARLFKVSIDIVEGAGHGRQRTINPSQGCPPLASASHTR